MNNQAKTKEELLKELEELQSKYNSIKVLKRKPSEELNVDNKELEFRNEGKEKRENEIGFPDQINQNIGESEKRYRTLFENMTAGFVLFEVVLNDKDFPIDLIIIDANKKFETTSGLQLDDAIGKRLMKVLPGIENDAADWIKTFGNIALYGESQKFEQGSELLGVYYSISAYQAEPMQCAVTFEDITERKKAEALLINQKVRFNTILNLVGDPIFVKDNEHKITYANNAFREMFNIDKDYEIGKTLVDSVPEDEQQHFLKVDREVLDTGISNLCEEKLTIGKKTRTIVTRKTRFIDKSGNKFLAASIHDITERKLAEKAIKQSEERISNLINSTDGIVWEADAQTFKFSFVSEKAEKLMGYSITDWYEDGFWATHIYKNDREEAIGYCVANTEQKLDHDFEYRFVCKNGKIIWLRDIVSVVVKDDGPSLLRGLMIDITNIKEAQEELENYRAHLEDLVKERTKELDEKNKKLNKMNNLFVGRELRMKELKEEIEKLKNKI
jgi:PAS domain S-box-containing protein